MKIHHIKNLPRINLSSVTIGKFDGFHKGHEHLISQLPQNSGIITFFPLPHAFFSNSTKVLYTNEEKEEAVLKYFSHNVSQLITLEFNQELANLSGEEFLTYISKITNHIIVGKDFKFGKDRSMNVDNIPKHGMKCTAVLPVEYKTAEGKVSSSNLKQAVQNGNFILYNTLSSIPFHITAKVTRGTSIASKTFQTPTANIVSSIQKIMPPFAVYATTTLIDGKSYKSISNYGIKPTFENSTPTLETHVFNFDGNLYDKKITVSFLKKIRNEIKFDNINQLHFQIMQDIKEAKIFHGIL